jgi:phosphoheptose isomerase
MSALTYDLDQHLLELSHGLEHIRETWPLIDRWAARLADAFEHGHKLLVAGNGGSAALAAHLTGELLGRFRDDRRSLPAVWIGADQSACTAIGNDFGFEHVFARPITALGSPGDVVLLVSTSGRSQNLIVAAAAARERGCDVWALTGAAPNPLAAASDHVLTTPGSTAIVQELQQVVVHLLCEAIDARVLGGP